MPGPGKPTKNAKAEHKQDKRFPLFILSLAVILTAIVLFASLWDIYYYGVTTEQIIQRYEARQEIIDRIENLRQRATLSTQRSVISADPFWRQQYEKSMPVLISALNQAVELADSERSLNSAIRLAESNEKLMDIERRVFSLVGQNEFARARDLVESDAYLDSLQDYNQSSQKFKSTISQKIETRRAEARRVTLLISIAGAAALFVALITWVILVKAIHRWHRTILREREALRESEAKYRSIFEQAALGIGRVRFSDATWIDVNDAFCNMLGYRTEELLTTPWPNITHPEDIDKDLINFKRMAAGELDHYSVEKRFIHKQGHIVWVRLTLSLVRNAKGQPDYEVAMIENITDRKLAEEALKESEEAFRAFIEATSDTVYRMSPDWKEMRYLRGRRFFPEVLEPKESWLDRYIYPDDKQSVLTGVENAMNKKSVYELEHRVIYQDETVGWINSRAVPIFDEHGEIREWFGTASDITERKKAQRLLERYELLARRSRDIILVVDRETGQIEEANQAAAKAYGWSRDELLNMKIQDLREPQTRGYTADQIAKAEVKGILFETMHLRKDGTSFPVEVSSQSANIDGKYTLVSVIRDITERKNIEKHREDLLNSLQEKTREMERFTAIIRHDFANPVISIQGFTEELVLSCHDIEELIKDQPIDESAKKEILNALEEDIPFSIDFIKDAVKQMNALLEGLRQVAAVGRAPVNIEPLDMSGLIEDLAITMTTQLKDADGDLTTGELPDCEGDAAQIKQVFGNLVTNALKYRHPDRPPKIHITGEVEKGYCVYRVVDNGMGIEPHNQQKVFDMFYRVDPDHPAPGDGVGLSIVAKILERHNGKIWLESEPDKGSTFFISLPAANR